MQEIFYTNYDTPCITIIIIVIVVVYFLIYFVFKDWADTIITTQNCKAKNEDHTIDNID